MQKRAKPSQRKGAIRVQLGCNQGAIRVQKGATAKSCKNRQTRAKEEGSVDNREQAIPNQATKHTKSGKRGGAKGVQSHEARFESRVSGE